MGDSRGHLFQKIAALGAPLCAVMHVSSLSLRTRVAWALLAHDRRYESGHMSTRAIDCTGELSDGRPGKTRVGWDRWQEP
jgi:hypothetical protein